MTQGSPAPTTTTTATAPPPPPPPRVAGSLYDAYLSELFNNASKKDNDNNGNDDDDDGEGDGLNVTKLDDDDALLPACNYFGQYPPPRSSSSSSSSSPSRTAIANSNTALSRNVCIITTAAMPWRTGTAVNPLLRALYLIRYRREQREREREQQQSWADGNDNSDHDDDDDNATKNTNNDNSNDDGGGKVALVIPWLESKEERIQLYGEQNSFDDDSNVDDEDEGDNNNEEDDNENNNSPQQSNNNDNHNHNNNNKSASKSTKSKSTTSTIGMAKQEAWIRHYSATACQMPLESQQLLIIFYPAFYQGNFGSIFPKVDLCNYIPSELVDVAILEEPEHLNWFRMPYYYNNNNNNTNDNNKDERNDERNDGIKNHDDDDGEGGVGEDGDNAA